jgi:tRNA 2-thiouridine synthesizing protein A
VNTVAAAAAATTPFDKEIDASGLACPLPIVRTKKALAGMASGQVLRVLGTDPGSIDDMPAFAESGGHTLLASTREDLRDGQRFVFLIRKG